MEKYLNKVDKILEVLLDDKVLVAKMQLEDMRKELIYDLALKNSKNKYEKEQLRSAKELLKSAQRDKSKILFHKIYQYEDTFQLCDGYVAVVLNNMIDGLELNKADGEYIDCRRYIKTSSGNDFRYDYNYEKVEIDLLDLEQQALKVRKVKEVPLPFEYAGHIGECYYNPINLLRAIKILGTKDVEVYLDKSGNYRAIFLCSEQGQALVLGIIKPKEPNK